MSTLRADLSSSSSLVFVEDVDVRLRRPDRLAGLTPAGRCEESGSARPNELAEAFGLSTTLPDD